MRKITKEFKGKTEKEFAAEIAKLRNEMAKARLTSKASPVKDTNSVTKMKKKLAVLLTLESQKA